MLTAVVVVAGVLVLGGWLWLRAHREAETQELVQSARGALLAGDIGRAEARIDALIVTHPAHPSLPALRGHLASAQGKHDAAARFFAVAWQNAVTDAAPVTELAPLSLDAANAMRQAGRWTEGLLLSDRALGLLHDVLDAHFDREDLSPDGRPLAGEKANSAGRTALAAVQVVALHGSLAADQARALHKEGNPAEATLVLDKAEDRVSSSVCTGTHRIVCRGVRASFRARALAPVVAVRTQSQVDAAIALVNQQRYEEALDVAAKANQGATEGRENAEDPGQAAAQQRQAAQVEYAVRVAWAKALEKQRKWQQAREQYDAADLLWQRHGALSLPGQATAGDAPPHVGGQARAAAVAEALDQTSSVLDKLSPLGLGDASRKALHARIEADPTNPQLYAELALQDARAARDGRLDPETSQVLVQRAETWLQTSRRVAPDTAMPRFYDGVLRFVSGDTGKGIKKMRRAYRKGYRDRAAELYLGEALAVVGRHRVAARHWQRAYEHDKAQLYALLRAVESSVAAGRVQAADDLVQEATARAENAGAPLGSSHEGAQAQAIVALAKGQHDAARKVLTVARAIGRPANPHVQRATSIGAAAYNKLGVAQLSAVLRPGEEVLDTVSGYAVPAGAATTERALQCALLVFTTRRLVVVRWDTAHDYRAEVQQGVALAGKALRLGRDLAGDWARYNLGIGGVHALLDQIAGRRTAQRPNRLGAATELVIDSLDLYDRIRADVERNIDPQKAQIFDLSGDQLVAWALTSEDPGKGLWMLTARRRDGRSPWATEGDHLHLVTDSAPWVRALLRQYLDGGKLRAALPPQPPGPPPPAPPDTTP